MHCRRRELARRRTLFTAHHEGFPAFIRCTRQNVERARFLMPAPCTAPLCERRSHDHKSASPHTRLVWRCERIRDHRSGTHCDRRFEQKNNQAKHFVSKPARFAVLDLTFGIGFFSQKTNSTYLLLASWPARCFAAVYLPSLQSALKRKTFPSSNERALKYNPGQSRSTCGVRFRLRYTICKLLVALQYTAA